jgi:hypothetical protein
VAARHTIFPVLLILVVASVPLDAQRRSRWAEPIPSWGVEPMVRLSILKDDPVMLIGARIGRQVDSTLNLGITGTMLWTESAVTLRDDGFDRITSLIFLGPSLELRDSLRGPVRFLARAAGVAGIVGYESERDGVAANGTAFIVGIEPELGVIIRATRGVQFTSTVGMLYGWRLDGEDAIVSGPIATAGIRFIR